MLESILPRFLYSSSKASDAASTSNAVNSSSCAVEAKDASRLLRDADVDDEWVFLATETSNTSTAAVTATSSSAMAKSAQAQPTGRSYADVVVGRAQRDKNSS